MSWSSTMLTRLAWLPEAFHTALAAACDRLGAPDTGSPCSPASLEGQ